MLTPCTGVGTCVKSMHEEREGEEDMNVSELIEELQAMPEDAEVRLAFQPSWPLQYHIDQVVHPDTSDECSECGGYLGDDPALLNHVDVGHDEGCSQPSPEAGTAVYITEGGQVSDAPYLPGQVSEMVGWR